VGSKVWDIIRGLKIVNQASAALLGQCLNTMYHDVLSLTQVIRKFAKQLDEWLKVALHNLPENLRNIKFDRKSLAVGRRG
jgi:hypothetical protein